MKEIIREWREWLIRAGQKARVFFSPTPSSEGGPPWPSPFAQWRAHVKANIGNRSMPYFWVACGAVFLLLFGIFLRASIPEPELAPTYGGLYIDDHNFASKGYFEIYAIPGDRDYGNGLVALNSLDPDYIKDNLKLTPRASFTLEERVGNRVRIHVTRPKNQPYEVSLPQPGGGEPVSFMVNSSYLLVELLNGDLSSSTNATIYNDDTVVLSFSSPVDPNTFEDSITITPSVDVFIDVDDMLVYIMPYTYWSTSSKYELTFSDDFQSIDGLSFGEAPTLTWNIRGTTTTPAPGDSSKLSSTEKTPYFSFVSPESRMRRADEPLTWEFSARNLTSGIPVVITTYRLDSAEKYRDQASIFEQYDVDLSILDRVDSNVYLAQNGGNIFSAANPGLGAYISEITYTAPGAKTETTLRQPFLVTDMTVYLQSNGSDALLWLNHYSTGQALTGYGITLVGEQGQMLADGMTGGQGIALLDVDFSPPEGVDNDDYYYYDYDSYYGNSIISITDPAGNLVYTDSTSVLSGSASRSRDRYYSYFYLDRGIYKPTDVISYWGYVSPHHLNTGEMPGSVFITFDPDNLNLEMEVPIDSFGAFQGEIPLEDIRSSQYYITASLRFPQEAAAEDEDDEAEGQAEDITDMADGDSEEADAEDVTDAAAAPALFTTYQLDSYYIDVKEYEKPTYVISSSTDQNWYTSDQMVTVTITPTFYDGTPLPNFPLEYQIYNAQTGSWGTVFTRVTDDKGVAQFTTTAAQGNKWLYKGDLLSQGQYLVRIVEDGENITHTGSYQYIATDVLYDAVFERRDDGNLHFELDTFEALSWNGLDEEHRKAFDSRTTPAALRGEAHEGGLAVRLEYSWWGSYTGGKSEWNSGVLDYNTDENGQLHIEDFLSDAGINREWDYVDVDLTVGIKDSYGNTLHSNYYYWTGMEQYLDRPSRADTGEENTPVPPGYSLVAYDSQGEQVSAPYYNYMYYDDVTFGAGQTMRFELQYQGEAIPQEGRLLYTIIQDGVTEYGIVQGTTLTLNQNVRYSPDINLTVAYFDGQEVHPVRSMMVTLDRRSLVTTLEITPDRESYRPGDTVQLQVKATDQYGSGVGGNLLISVVDESIFALKEQNINVLSTLHGDIYYNNYGFVRRYTTAGGDHTWNPGTGGDEGKGSGESVAFYDSYRSNFKDTAAFLPVRTDSAGNAVVQFTLPDNTTSWRVTSLSVGDNLYAGQQRDNVISTLPFFISPVISPKYIVGDEIAILVQGHGTLLDDESEIEYSVTITGDGVNETLEAEGGAYESHEINFGQLPMGEYTVVATARYSGYSDTVELPLSVINSNLELVIHKKLDVGETLDIQAVRYPVVVTFYDSENEAFFDSIGSLMGHYCMVANQRMSRFVAKRALEDRMDPASIPQYILEKDNDYASNMQNKDGGIGWTVGSPSEPILTTKVLLVAMDQFDLGAMAGYFRGILQTSTDEMELAAAYLGLAAIGEAVSDDILELLDNEELALSTSARAYLIAGLAYAEHPRTGELYDDMLAVQVRNMNLGFMPKYTYKDVPAIWVAASKIAPDDADDISSFLAKSYWRYDTLFECMIYVTNYNREFTPRVISYEVDGVTHNINLGLQGQYSVSFTKSEFESLRLISIPEGVNAMAYYIGEPGELGLTPSDLFEIDKTVEDMGDGKYKFTVKLRFTNEAPTGQYDISDWVPSNMRLYTVEDSKADVTYTEEGQKLYFTLHRGTLDRDVEIVYYARKTYDAQAILDSIYVIHGDSGENASTEKGALPN